MEVDPLQVLSHDEHPFLGPGIVVKVLQVLFVCQVGNADIPVDCECHINHIGISEGNVSMRLVVAYLSLHDDPRFLVI